MTSTIKPKSKPGLFRPRLAVLTMFFLNGAIFANWAGRIPAVKAQLNLSEGILGFTLLGMSLGVILALPLAGGLIQRYSSRRVTAVSAILYILSVPLLALAPLLSDSAWSLFAALFIFGAAMSAMDMGMNAQAVEVERRHRKTIMNSFHAAWSLGGFSGAVISSGAVALNLSVLNHFSLMTAIFLLIAVVAMRELVTVPEEVRKVDDNTPVFAMPPRAVWGLGIVAFCTAVGEGTMADWSAVYLSDIVAAPATIAAWGYAAFQITMTAGRLSGDYLARRTDPVLLVRGGALVAGSGLALAILFPSTTVVLVGFALIGAGLSFIIPMTFSAAGNLPDVSPGIGIAGVATIGYTGFLAAPPIIGVLAQTTSLRLAFLLILLLIVGLFLAGGALRRAEMPASPPSHRD